MIRVSEINIYPLKSAAGIALESAELDAFGFRHDRRWMVVDNDGQFLTQRAEPRLALVRTSIDDAALCLEATGCGPLRLPLDHPGGARRPVRVWADDTEAVDAGDDAARWISTALGRPARIVHMPDDIVRPVDASYSVGDDRVSFVDAFPFLLISQASLDELNRRLDHPLPMNRFRPNLVVEGTEPHAEDGWQRIRMGDVTFAVVKPCARCVTTTIDQATGVAGREPLRTLATYRKVGSNVLFGQNLIHRAMGAVRVGDEVEVVAETDASASGLASASG
jgi:hypothetical protein